MLNPSAIEHRTMEALPQIDGAGGAEGKANRNAKKKEKKKERKKEKKAAGSSMAEDGKQAGRLPRCFTGSFYSIEKLTSGCVRAHRARKRLRRD